MVVDITDRKRAEEALQKAHDELEMRVSERTAQLVKTNQELQSEIEVRKKAEESLKKSEMELKRLSARLLEAHEEESKRIGQELHDGLAQTMSAIKVWGENALLQMRKGESKDSLIKTLESVVRLAQGSVEEVRRILGNLRPSILDDLGILSTISWLCHEFETIYSGIGIKKDIYIEENQIPDSLKIVIFRILQEAFNNIAKHSKANLARLSLKKTEDNIELSIHDDGKGFDVVHAFSVNQPSAGFGLASMRERSELSGGSFSIDSRKGEGTTIRVSWPYRNLQSPYSL
jgi:signal transduction histidine kinase